MMILFISFKCNHVQLCNLFLILLQQHQQQQQQQIQQQQQQHQTMASQSQVDREVFHIRQMLSQAAVAQFSDVSRHT